MKVLSMQIKRNQVFRSYASGIRIRVLSYINQGTGRVRDNQAIVVTVDLLGRKTNRRLIAADSIRRRYHLA